MIDMHKYLFVLSPPYCGSTVLWRLLHTSPAGSAHPKEGQMLNGVKHIMRDGAWDPEKKFPWAQIKTRWEAVWDTNKTVLIEKSPPNIVRAFEIEKAFRPAYFIVMIRDPYAFCEGRRRRHEGSDIKASAQFWASCTSHQQRNVQGLERVTYFKYEDFAERPLDIKDQILKFLPELEDIDITEPFQARSIQGRGNQTIQNFNREKMDRLSARDIKEINSVLRPHEQLLGFFGYEYLEPTVGQSWRHLKAMASSNTVKMFDKTKRAGARLLNRGR